MSKAYNLNQKNDFSSTASHFKTSLASVKLNSSNSNIHSTLNLKIEKLGGRRRHVIIKTPIFHPPEQIWQVLTDYESFSEFMPNVVQCRRLNCPKEGVRIEQFHAVKFMGIKFSDRAVFDIEENFPHKIRYELVEGDMKVLSGEWRLEPLNLPESEVGFNLTYDFIILPQLIFPMVLVERILNQKMPETVLAVRQRVKEIFES